MRPPARPARGGPPLRALAVLLGFVLLAAACTHRGAGATDTTASPPDPFGRIAVGPEGKLEIGVLLGVSDGDTAAVDATRQGVQLAVDYLDGAFDGRPGQLMDHAISLVIERDPCSGDGARAGAEDLASDPGIVGVIGALCPTVDAGAVDRILSDRGVLLISPVNDEPTLTAQGTHQPFFLRTAENEALDAVVMADFARGTGGAETAAVIHDASDASVALTGHFTATFETKGGTVATTDQVDVSGSGLSQALQDLGKAPPDFLYVPGSDPSCASVVREAQDVAGLSATELGSSSACLGAFRSTSGDAQTGPFLSAPDRSDVTGGEFYTLQFLPAYEEQPDAANLPVVAAFAFDAANILFDAMQVSATRGEDASLIFGRSALRDAIFATDSYEGLTGPLTCTPLGDCGAPMRFAVYLAVDVPVDGQPAAAKPVFTEVVSSGDLAP